MLRHSVRQFAASTLPPSSTAADVECVVIGAGVIGLAIGRALALAGKEVMVLEAANHWGTETSARHSEVIHAGLYYPTGSLKARFCVEGKQLLYEYLAARGVSHRRVTKLVVATDDKQVAKLKAIHAKAEDNGVHDLRWLTGSQAQQLEPQLRATAALLSPSTGIFDSHGYMTALLADAENAGASLAVGSKVVGGKVEHAPVVSAVPSSAQNSRGPEEPASTQTTTGSAVQTSTQSIRGTAGQSSTNAVNTEQAGATRGIPAAGLRSSCLLQVEDTQSGDRMWLRARQVINAAGLWAQQVSHLIQGIPEASIPPLYMARGVYFSLDSNLVAGQQNQESGDSSQTKDSTVREVEGLPGARPFPPSKSRPFNRLIYPLPQDGGIGVHVTLDMSGATKFGPDVEWGLKSVDYKVDPARGAAFYKEIRAYWPHLPDGALQPGYAGVRPKLSGPGQPPADFMIQGEAGPGGHGVPGLVCLYGIESPGLTSSLAIAEYVKQLVLTGQPKAPSS